MKELINRSVQNPEQKSEGKERYKLLKRTISISQTKQNDPEIKKKIIPSYDERKKYYNIVRNRIFNDEICLKKIRRTRERFKEKKQTYKDIRDTVNKCEAISDKISVDPRAFANIKIGNAEIRGLLDTGASISILGRNSENILNALDVKIKQFFSEVKTAGGSKERSTSP